MRKQNIVLKEMLQINYDKLCGEMIALKDYPDTRNAHFRADSILELMLSQCGAYKIVEAYRNVEKWYG